MDIVSEPRGDLAHTSRCKFDNVPASLRRLDRGRNALRGKRALCNTEMEGKITKAEAEARGLVVDTTVYPRVA